tara:strand:+ start:3022 stop:3930 length:909 start_codon:yes stop_codon:yes gene_type:complete
MTEEKAKVGKDEYDNPGEAGARAKEIGCTGIHSHNTPKGKIFMPCKNHDDYMNAIAKNKNKEEDLQDFEDLTNPELFDDSINVKGQRQVFECEVKATSEQEGTFEGYASTFNNIDKGNDIVVSGAFRKSLRRRPYQKVKLLYQHRTDEPIGVFESMKEDENGLFVKGRLAMGTQKGRESYELLKMGALDAMSIGFKADPKMQSYDERRRRRYLKEIDLMEVSLVTFPMNDKAIIHQVKGTDRTIREWEDLLRDAGDLSRVDAKIGAKALITALEQREVEDDYGDVIEKIKKVKQLIKGDSND